MSQSQGITYTPFRSTGAPSVAGLVNRRISDRDVDADPISYREQMDPRGDLPDESLLNRHPAYRAQVRLYRRDVLIQRPVVGVTRHKGGGIRSEISNLSNASRRRMVLRIRNAPDLPFMLTLTYPKDFPCDGRLVKLHLSLVRKWLSRQDVKGVWFLEFQKRGAPHFHLFTTAAVDRDAIRAYWAGVVNGHAHGKKWIRSAACPHCEFIERKGLTHYRCSSGCSYSKSYNAGIRQEKMRKSYAACAYAVKESSKMAQKDVPADFQQVGRFWGYFGFTVKADLVVTGTIEEVAPFIRVIKKLAERVAKPYQPYAMTDKGRYGITVYTEAEKLLPQLQRYLFEHFPIRYGTDLEIDLCLTT